MLKIYTVTLCFPEAPVTFVGLSARGVIAKVQVYQHECDDEPVTVPEFSKLEAWVNNDHWCIDCNVSVHDFAEYNYPHRVTIESTTPVQGD